MRLSKYALTPLRSRDLWLAIGIVVLFVVSMGFYQFQTGHLPSLGHSFSNGYWGGVIVLIWSLALLRLRKEGRRAFGGQQMTFLVGYTFFAGSNLVSQPSTLIMWLSNIGTCAVVAIALLPYLGFGKRGEPSAGKTG